MTQPANWGVPETSPANPTLMATRMNSSLEALLTQHAGDARPDYIEAGSQWAKKIYDEEEEPNLIGYEIYFYDGTGDILLYSVDTSTQKIISDPVAGTQIGFATAKSSTSVSTTSTDGVDVISVSYTPKKATSLIIVEVYAERMTASYDFGTGVQNGEVATVHWIMAGATQIGGILNGSQCSTKSDGVLAVNMNPYIQGQHIAGTTDAITYKSMVAPQYSGHTGGIARSANRPIVINVKEIAQ